MYTILHWRKSSIYMFTLLIKSFISLNQETFGTNLQTIFSGKLKWKDSFGNKYDESKSGKRWIIYKDEVNASKIPVEWYSWIHFTKNKIEDNHELEKYSWQKRHQPNLTGTKSSYHPNKDDKKVIKKYKRWKN